MKIVSNSDELSALLKLAALGSKIAKELNISGPFNIQFFPRGNDIKVIECNLEYHQYTNLEDVIPKVDILYMTRVQRERFSDPIEYEKVKDSCLLNKSLMVNCKPNMKVLHPLPRVNKIDTDVDDTPRAYYFQQAQNGVYVRQAILASILEIDPRSKVNDIKISNHYSFHYNATPPSLNIYNKSLNGLIICNLSKHKSIY